MTYLPCLYCEDVARPRTSEHVLQRAFDANLTLPDDVCDDCNTRVFSPIDKALADFVRTYAYWDHPHVRRTRTMLQDGHSLWLDDGVWLSVRVDKAVRPIVFTQLVFLSESKVHVTLDNSSAVDLEVELSKLRTELESPAQLSLDTILLSTPADGPPVQPALIRSAPRKYVIRGSTEADAAALRDRVLDGRLLAGMRSEGAPQARSEQIKIENRIEVDMGAIARALVKSALNLVCKASGPDVARRSQFDEARRFALGHGAPGSFERLVTILGRDDAGLENLAEPDRHTMVLSEADRPTVVISLYGRPFAVVRLTAEPSRALPPDTMVVASFDYLAKTSEIVRMIDDPIDFARRFKFIR